MLTSMKKARPAGITMRILLSHMQNMQQVLVERMDRLEKRIDAKIDHTHHLLVMQLDGIDARLNGMEIEFLPRRVKALEVAMRKR